MKKAGGRRQIVDNAIKKFIEKDDLGEALEWLESGEKPSRNALEDLVKALLDDGRLDMYYEAVSLIKERLRRKPTKEEQFKILICLAGKEGFDWDEFKKNNRIPPEVANEAVWRLVRKGDEKAAQRLKKNLLGDDLNDAELISLIRAKIAIFSSMKLKGDESEALMDKIRKLFSDIADKKTSVVDLVLEFFIRHSDRQFHLTRIYADRASQKIKEKILGLYINGGNLSEANQFARVCLKRKLTNEELKRLADAA